MIMNVYIPEDKTRVFIVTIVRFSQENNWQSIIRMIPVVFAETPITEILKYGYVDKKAISPQKFSLLARK